MCGLVGVLYPTSSDRRVDPVVLERMRDVMAHRGPDSTGLFISEDQRIGLGHRRLSIIDLSSQADQPMTDPDGHITIVFNGEIYNHAELRSELEQLGHRNWRTDHADTEVVIRAYLEWGIECVDRFQGMFAFGMWDARTEELWLVRDRVGIKPLYYTERNGQVSFASEIKALLVEPGCPREIDEESLYHYLTFRAVPAPRTLFRGIQKIPAGTWINFGRDRPPRIRRYWDVWDHVTSLESRSDDEIADGLLEQFTKAVDQRKVSDRSVGVFLSGGVDSSANAALFSRDRSDPIDTFTIGYDTGPTPYPDESQQARDMAQSLGARHHISRLSQNDVSSFLDTMAFHQDEPLGDQVCVPLYYVSKLARENGQVVCQVGEGADELFHGYDSWAKVRRLSKLLRLAPGRRSISLLAGLASTLRPNSRTLPAYLRRAGRGEPIFLSGAEAFSAEEKSRLLSASVRSRLSGISTIDPLKEPYKRFQENAPQPDIANWMSYADLTVRLPELLLMRVDKMSMAVSLEARVPFLAHDLVAYAMSIPTSVKLRDGISKSILKRAVRGTVPDAVIDRPKLGFGLPVEHWMRKIMADGHGETIDEFCSETGLLDPTQVDLTMKSGDSARSWTVLNLALWWRAYFSKSAVI